MSEMPGHENCNHTEVQYVIIRLAEETMMSMVMTITPMVASGEIDPAHAGISSATMIFATGLETGIRAALIDPIGAQLILDDLDDAAPVSGAELDEANRVMANDARTLLEAAARQTHG